MRAPAPPPGLFWVAALGEPRRVLAYSLDQWQEALRIARRLRLLGRLAHAVAAAGLLSQVPAPVQAHLVAEARFSRARTRSLTWTLERVMARWQGAGFPAVLLKGAAYIAQGLDIAHGRLPSDADVLVPRASVDAAQAALAAAGWAEVELDAHDRRYYHEWSHEVPPMRHPVHPLELDLHHNILPPVARTRVDAAVLLARLQPATTPGFEGWQVLHPQDQLLHSAAHLFFESEARDRLRDLVDLDGLMRHFGADPAFWRDLPERAAALNLQVPLAMAVHFATGWLGTPVPGDALARVQAQGPGPVQRAVLAAIFGALLRPVDPDRLPPASQALAAQALLLRYHLWRMPLRLLVPHLWHKWRSERAAELERPGAAGPAA